MIAPQLEAWEQHLPIGKFSNSCAWASMWLGLNLEEKREKRKKTKEFEVGIEWYYDYSRNMLWKNPLLPIQECGERFAGFTVTTSNWSGRPRGNLTWRGFLVQKSNCSCICFAGYSSSIAVRNSKWTFRFRVDEGLSEPLKYQSTHEYLRRHI